MITVFIYRDDQTDGTLPDTEKKQRKVTSSNIIYWKIGIPGLLCFYYNCTPNFIFKFIMIDLDKILLGGFTEFLCGGLGCGLQGWFFCSFRFSFWKKSRHMLSGYWVGGLFNSWELYVSMLFKYISPEVTKKMNAAELIVWIVTRPGC